MIICMITRRISPTGMAGVVMVLTVRGGIDCAFLEKRKMQRVRKVLKTASGVFPSRYFYIYVLLKVHNIKKCK